MRRSRIQVVSFDWSLYSHSEQGFVAAVENQQALDLELLPEKDAIAVHGGGGLFSVTVAAFSCLHLFRLVGRGSADSCCYKPYRYFEGKRE